ncbi:hypothetical protein KKB18_09550 [bacterium]|nr:hypothetical protein [bacterium]
MVYIFTIVKKRENIEEEPDIKILPMTKSIIFICLGIAGLTFGGKWIVDGAVQIANVF